MPYSSSSSRRSLGELVWLEGRERGEAVSCKAAAWGQRRHSDGLQRACTFSQK